jgi:hypothetical protein
VLQRHAWLHQVSCPVMMSFTRVLRRSLRA